MHGKLGGAIVMTLAGFVLAWAGFAWGLPVLGSKAAPLRSLSLVAAMALVVTGVWLCWHGTARLLRPPPAAGRVVNLLAGSLLGGLAIAAGFLALTDLGIA